VRRLAALEKCASRHNARPLQRTGGAPYRVPVEVSSSDSGQTWRTRLFERLTFFRFARQALGGHWEREINYSDKSRSHWTRWRRLKSCSQPSISTVASWALHCEGPLRTFARPEESHAISIVVDDFPIEDGDIYVQRVDGRICAWIPAYMLGRP
jgi:hypothetical protein